ncbi:MAG: superoxide dismutase [Verrucomicrobiota bacterium]|jgi:Fe-Mn family superoxide dismutase
MPFAPAPLAYGLNDLAPTFESSILDIHYNKHHAAYANNLNKLLEGSPLASFPLEQLVANLAIVPEAIRTGVKRNAGQVYNHDLYWASLSPKGGGEPVGALADAITAEFGSYAAFREKFAAAAATQFGSGWAFLSVRNGKLEVSNAPNEESPLMNGGKPVLTLDVWEHAYYLQFQNRRPDFITAFWNLTNWQNADMLYRKAAAASMGGGCCGGGCHG